MQAAACAPEATRLTRLDAEKLKKRESNRKAVQKHRTNQHPQKKRHVREKRMEYYYRQKDAKVTKEQQQREKAMQADIALNQVNCPYRRRTKGLLSV